MAKLLAVERPTSVYPQLDRDYLLATLKNELERGGQCHPRIHSLQSGHAVFESSIKAQWTPNCKVGYYVICRVPLSDQLFHGDREITYLYYSQAAPYATFVPFGYYDNRGNAIGQPR